MRITCNVKLNIFLDGKRYLQDQELHQYLTWKDEKDFTILFKMRIFSLDDDNEELQLLEERQSNCN